MVQEKTEASPSAGISEHAAGEGSLPRRGLGNTPAARRDLPGFPSGWFSVGMISELPVGGILSRQFMGHDLVIFRTKSGQACAMDAYCPHLGAHFAHGGTIEGETIRCPFHGFCFDQRGECVATGYNTKPPPAAKARVWPLREINGMLMVYHGPGGKEPTWEIPALETAGWTPLLSSVWRLRSHPQETVENGVDIGHLSWTHGYQSVEMLSDLTTDGPFMDVRYAMHRPLGLLSKGGQGLRGEFTLRAHGLGFSVVVATIPAYGLCSRFLICATPVEKGWIEMRTAMTMQKITRPQQINPLLWLLPRPLVNWMVAKFTYDGFVHDLKQDFVIWEHKRYVQPPALAAGDGPIGKYRTWARQFYPLTDQLEL